MLFFINDENYLIETNKQTDGNVLKYGPKLGEKTLKF